MAPIQFNLMLIFAAATGMFFLFILGLFLLWRGIWPRRQGDTPYCGRCNYNLTGIASGRCPECGRHLTPATIVQGQRRRRPGMIVAGGLSLLPLTFFGAAWLGHVDWYKHKPTGWVISDLNTTKLSDWQKAWNELDRRNIAGELSQKHGSRLIDVCLVEQGKKGPSSGRMSNCVDFLGDAYLHDAMSDVQAEEFFEQIIQVELKVREKIIVGENIPYLVTEQSRCPSSPWRISLKDRKRLVDGRRVGSGGGSKELSGGGSAGTGGSFSYPLEPGVHTLTVPLSLTVYSASTAIDVADSICHRREITLSAPFEVLAVEPPEYITMVNDPTLHDRLLKCFEPRNFRMHDNPVHGVRGEIAATPTPNNVAFDVVARVHDEEFKMRARIVCKKGETPPRWHHQCFWRYDGPPIDSFDLILRSSEQLVRESVDLYDAWEGELVYEDVPVSSNGVRYGRGRSVSSDQPDSR